MGYRFWGLWVLGSGFWVVGSRFWVLGCGLWVLGSGLIEVLGFSVQVSGARRKPGFTDT